MRGEFTEVNEFPWAALLNLSSSENGETSRCGGSLISDRFLKVNASIQFNKFLFRHLITAAHCIQEHSLDGDILFEYDNITIILGRYFSPHLSKNLIFQASMISLMKLKRKPLSPRRNIWKQKSTGDFTSDVHRVQSSMTWPSSNWRIL